MTVVIYESADCVRDHDFRTETDTHHPLQKTGSDSVKIRSSRAAVVCLVLLCVLLLTAVIVLCVHIHTNNTNCTEETHQLLTKITNLTEEGNQLLSKMTNFTEEKDQLLTKITNLTEERDQLLIKIPSLTEEHVQLLTNMTNLNQINEGLIQEKHELLKCFNGMDGWKFYRSGCYLISSVKKNWAESRRYCMQRGADLIIINNREKQNFVKEISGNNPFWIGLTDTGVEGRWKWVDGSTPTSEFWQSGQPNGHRKENCAMTYTLWWYDYPCNYTFKCICERNIF
ncbi:CD209 antigen-like protein C [Labeo rohita]|uniref:CD209 antigen-like protein C n=1 Tax=Labeo rohita TaxID=84645 RepID=UPI0021E20CDB|nr:CD209 antigen-like protein C [Labeo rohita]